MKISELSVKCVLLDSTFNHLLCCTFNLGFTNIIIKHENYCIHSARPLLQGNYHCGRAFV